VSEAQWRPRAQTAALTQLTHEFWDRYRELLAEERAAGVAVRPQSAARTRLSREHPERYRELYNQERDRLAALPADERFSVRPRYVQIRKKKGAA
jgi:hypothetical protein